ncbi:hypothetical protein [Chitinophaga qingshengii]|uniref:TROVE domain-containing protein n=1 Tax=Chitinophaga qingshengii TaxID=1569794 RepID=A0ABR7TI75_9BACT|nr:hypothetical protein [Chitinophaga qingshengii]MBC9930218.1 hypothetical protein [Chitinophaga qingshengii]
MNTYFQLSGDYCWRWSEEGRVIELHNGFTVCYTEALTGLLQQMNPPGWPPLSTVLFLLCACKNNDTQIALTTWNLREIVQRIYPSSRLPENTAGMLEDACHLLELVHALPLELRQLNQHAHLITTLFEGFTPHIDSQQATAALEQFTPGYHYNANAVSTLEWDLSWLSRAGKKYTALPELVQALTAGTTRHLSPLPADLPLPDASDLLTQLERHEKTIGISRLARRIMAAIHVPMHTYNSGERLLGGFSDLANKGNYDRLLISELAQDDLLLTARLANQEALYLRREEVPLNRKKKVIILLDITLKMWGIPRIFGMAAALACRLQQANDTDVTAWALGEANVYPINLDTPDTMEHALSFLDNGLHIVPALTFLLEKRQEDTEYYLITGEKPATHPDLQAILAAHPPKVDFLLTVDREGAFHCYHYSGGRKKQISQAQFDLEEITHPGIPASEKKKDTTAPLSAIRMEDPVPVRLPVTNMRNKPGYHFYWSNDIVSITRDGRVECRSRNRTDARGGLECCRYVEQGVYELMVHDQHSFSLLVNTNMYPTLILYHFTQEGNTFSYKRIVTDAPAKSYVIETSRSLFCLYPTYMAVDGITGAYVDNDIISFATADYQQGQKEAILKSMFKELSRHVFALSTVSKIFITREGELIIQGRKLYIETSSKGATNLLIAEANHHTPDRVPVNKMVAPLPGNPLIRQTRFTWADGSYIVSDTRGFLFLRSSDESIPDIVIVMALSAPTAAWTNGHFTGNPYFQLNPDDTIVRVAEFYNQYILRFIAQLR